MRDCLHDYSPFCRDTAALQQSAVCQYSAARESDLRHGSTELAILDIYENHVRNHLGKMGLQFLGDVALLFFTVFNRGRQLFTPHDHRWSWVSARRRGTRCKICAADSGLADTRRRQSPRRRALCLHMRRRAEVAGIKQRMVWRARTSRPGDGAPCTQHGKHTCKISTHLSSDFPDNVTDTGTGWQ